MSDFDPRKDEDRAYLAGALTAYALGLKPEEVLSGGRGSPAEARARQVAMYLAKQLTTRSLPEIGRKFGGRDHTTVMHAVRQITSKRENDPSLANDVERIERSLLDNFCWTIDRSIAGKLSESRADWPRRIQ